MNPRLAEIGAGRFAHASGALWMPDVATLLIADVHLGYGWAMRRRHRLGPVSEGGLNAKLRGVLEELQPRTVVLLGDIVHAPRPAPEERQLVEDALTYLGSQARLIVVPGNHDRHFTRDYASLSLEIVHAWEHDLVVAVHGDKPVPFETDKHVLMGHIHPALPIVDSAGASIRVPAFLTSERLTILPAFSPFASGYCVGPRLNEPLRSLFGSQAVHVIAASGRRAVRIGPLSRATPA